MNRFLLLVASTFLLIGCGGGSTSGSTGSAESSSSDFTKQNKTIAINSSSSIYRVKGAKSSDLELNIDSKKDIFVIVTSRFNNQDISIGSKVASAPRGSGSLSPRRARGTTQMRKEINDILFSKSKATPRARLLNTRERVISQVSTKSDANFCVDMDSFHNCLEYVGASVKKIVKNIKTPQGSKSLVIWLQDGNNLSQSSIDKLADIFLKSGEDNDIYDWVSNVYGKEWGSEANYIDSKLIHNSDIIDILVYNMNNYGLAGYFWGKDNFKRSEVGASNEKIMFYINSELLKRDPKETYTTLAHEFQHMIHFYQRSVIKGIEDAAWYDELMSEATEDLVATKIGYMGPRHVDSYNGTAGRAGNRGGRYPNFNRYNTVALTTWQNTTRDYSKVSAFGGYLLRNYGGANFLKRMMYTNNQDEYGVLDATKEKSFSDLIANWGVAVLLSDTIDASNKFRYNFGDFRYTELNDITYELGSVNFFNYAPQPMFKSSAKLDKNANLYYKVGDNISGNIKLHINIPKGADITIVAK
jgi:hypothetical protein